tara:strand:+ start:84 stop:227 length:144 start_codon:yes stop_codon:yes gene_type:complete
MLAQEQKSSINVSKETTKRIQLIKIKNDNFSSAEEIINYALDKANLD